MPKELVRRTRESLVKQNLDTKVEEFHTSLHVCWVEDGQRVSSQSYRATDELE